MSYRVALVPLYHTDYPSDMGMKFAKLAARKLEDKGLDVLTTEGVNELSKVDGVVKEIVHHDPDAVILFVSTWIEAPRAVDIVMALPRIPLIVWGLRMYYEKGRRESTGSLPGACVLKGSLEAMGYKIKFIVGLPTEESVIEEVYKYCMVSNVVHKIRNSRIGLVGYASMGMYTATFDHIFIRKKLGLEIFHIDSSTIFGEMARIEDSSALEVCKSWRNRYFIEEDVHQRDLIIAAKMYLALKKLIEEHHLEAISIKCQYEFSKELGFVPCVPLSILADEGVVCSCEGDIPLTITMMLLHYLTLQPIFYGDIIDIRENRVYLSSCGFAPLSLASSFTMGIGKHKFFFEGLRSGIVLKKGEVTLARLGHGKGRYEMHIASGEIVDTKLRQGLFPAAEIELYGDVRMFIENIKSQHYALAYGDLRQLLRDVCDLLEIGCVIT